MDCGIVLAYFSPCGFKLLRQHAITSLKIAIASGVPVSFAEVIQPGQVPLEVPPGLYSHIVLESADIMFYKENLWNLAAQKLPTKNLLFLDADVHYTDEAWLEKINSALESADVIQPFDVACWLDRAGGVIEQRPACLCAMATSPQTGISLQNTHTGFGFAMTKSVFERIGGFYDLCVAGGGGDVVFVYALTDTHIDRGNMRKREYDTSFRFFSPSYTRYRNRALCATLRVGCVPNLSIMHRWHGKIENRQYNLRGTYFNDYGAAADFPVTRRPDGLLQWTVPQENAKNYFLARNEDFE